MSKAEDRKIAANVKRHYELMTQFINEGLSKDEASRKAYDIVVGKQVGVIVRLRNES